jgi:hypothetical protein
VPGAHQVQAKMPEWYHPRVERLILRKTGVRGLPIGLVFLFVFAGTLSMATYCRSYFRPGGETKYPPSASNGGQNSLLRVDLRPYGFGAAKPWKTSSFRIGVLNREYHEVAFGGSEKIIAAITSSPNPDARHLRALTAVILDARSGSILAKGNWDAVYDKLGLLPTPSGNIVIRVDDALRLYTSELKLLQEIALPLSRVPGTKYWQVFLTPSGKSLVLERGVDKSLELEWLDPDSLKLNQVWNAPAGMFYQTGNSYAPLDDGVLITLKDMQLGSCEITYVNSEGAWATSYRIATQCKQPARPVDNATFFVREGNEFVIRKKDGSILIRQPIKKGEFADVIRPSADGNRLAIAFEVEKGGSEFFDVNSHEVLKRIQVCDITSRQMIFTIESKNIDLQGVSDFGLSPDGSQLVLLRSGIIETYSVP